MKEFIELIKKLWGNKRHRAIAILLIYFIFFIFVFSVIENDNNVNLDELKQKQEQNDKDNSKEDNKDNVIIENKEFRLQIIGLENFIIDNNTIIYEEVSYSIDSGIIDLSKYNIDYFTIDNINDLISKGILESVNYIDNSKSYLIDVINYDNTKEGNFRIIVYENKIEIDLVEYFNYKVIMEYKRS